MWPETVIFDEGIAVSAPESQVSFSSQIQLKVINLQKLSLNLGDQSQNVNLPSLK